MVEPVVESIEEKFLRIISSFEKGVQDLPEEAKAFLLELIQDEDSAMGAISALSLLHQYFTDGVLVLSDIVVDGGQSISVPQAIKVNQSANTVTFLNRSTLAEQTSRQLDLYSIRRKVLELKETITEDSFIFI